MAFPLPVCPAYRRLVVSFWLDDIDDRLSTGHIKDAEVSWRIANEIYLSLGPGEGDMELEDWMCQQRVKLDKRLNATNENYLQRHTCVDI